MKPRGNCCKSGDNDSTYPSESPLEKKTASLACIIKIVSWSMERFGVAGALPGRPKDLGRLPGHFPC